MIDVLNWLLPLLPSSPSLVYLFLPLVLVTTSIFFFGDVFSQKWGHFFLGDSSHLMHFFPLSGSSFWPSFWVYQVSLTFLIIYLIAYFKFTHLSVLCPWLLWKQQNLVLLVFANSFIDYIFSYSKFFKLSVNILLLNIFYWRFQGNVGWEPCMGSPVSFILTSIKVSIFQSTIYRVSWTSTIFYFFSQELLFIVNVGLALTRI